LEGGLACGSGGCRCAFHECSAKKSPEGGPLWALTRINVDGLRMKRLSVSTRHLHWRNPGVGFVFPAVAFILICGVVPMATVIRLSLSSIDFASGRSIWVGLKNYASALDDPRFWSAAWHTVRYVLLCVSLHTLFGLGFALLLNSRWLKRSVKAVFRTLMVLPWTSTLVVTALIWRLILNPQFSPLNALVTCLGINWTQSLLTNTKIAFLGIVLANVWNFTPFYMLMFLAQLQSISPVLYEVAELDGAGAWRKLLYVTLPELEQIAWFLVIYDVIGTFIQFDLVWLMTNGGPLGSTEVLATLCYRTAFESFDLNLASAVGILMVIGMLMWTGVLWIIVRKRRLA